jgi:succinate dehydrogenase / fumarate reductase, cytochrome b subunit
MSTLVAPEDTQRTGSVTADAIPPEIRPRSVLATRARAVLAVSGFIMLGFVVLHLAGNMLAFAGSGTFNAYARSLREMGTPVVGQGALLWFARVVLAGTLASHLAAHLYLMREPTSDPWETPTSGVGATLESTRYAPTPPWYATLPLVWLQATGALIAVFVAFHIAQLTIGALHPAFVTDDPYHNMVVALGVWPVSIAYIAAAMAVGAHLLPGIWTGMRSLGLIRPGREALAGTLSVFIPLVLVASMTAVPIAVLVGVLR